MPKFFSFLAILMLPITGFTQDQYQVPPEPISRLVNAPQTPAVLVNDQGTWLLLLERPGYASISDLAQPELRLAGLRFNPKTNGPSRSAYYSGMLIQSIDGKNSRRVTGLPDEPRLRDISWSPNGKKIGFTIQTPNSTELWVADFATGEARSVTDVNLNSVLRGSPYQWMADGEKILFKAMVKDRGEAPQQPSAPPGPIIQESNGDEAPVRTYQDLLQNPQDESLFQFYAVSQLQVLDLASGVASPIGNPGIIRTISLSPDNQYILLTVLKKPFSYIVPYYRFPFEALIIDLHGNLIKQVADIPLAENIPKGFDAVRTGPRSFRWRADQAATLYWVQALDGGDPAQEADHRDQLFYLPAPFEGDAIPDVKLKLRFSGVDWGHSEFAITYERWWLTRQHITASFHPGQSRSRKIIFDRSFEDRYNDPGDFEITTNQYGEHVLLLNERGELLLTGVGASAEGNRPLLRAFQPDNGKIKELWRSQAPFYEFPLKVFDKDGTTLLTRRESREQPPNFYLRDLKKNRLTALTDFEHPYPELAGVEKKVIHYQRKDGVALKGDLYLPPGYEPSQGPLPVIMWAYPSEYKSADAASQVEGSPYEFIRLGWWTPLYFLTRGYAILDDPSMPVIGEGEDQPNDSFRSQLVMNAAAAVEKLKEMGVSDGERIAIGGHSYGAFMTANLLAHSDLFAGGIARSGAYNRTLTPFGFQAEERTYWEAPEVYYRMSPFMHADKINEPILMIHGEADNNSGTFPVQSKRYFAALKGMGAQARLVMLPYESHGYRAKESILHMLWEMDRFLEKYIKPVKQQQLEEIRIESGVK